MTGSRSTEANAAIAEDTNGEFFRNTSRYSLVDAEKPFDDTQVQVT